MSEFKIKPDVIKAAMKSENDIWNAAIEAAALKAEELHDEAVSLHIRKLKK